MTFQKMSHPSGRQKARILGELKISMARLHARRRAKKTALLIAAPVVFVAFGFAGWQIWPHSSINSPTTKSTVVQSHHPSGQQAFHHGSQSRWNTEKVIAETKTPPIQVEEIDDAEMLQLLDSIGTPAVIARIDGKKMVYPLGESAQ